MKDLKLLNFRHYPLLFILTKKNLASQRGKTKAYEKKYHFFFKYSCTLSEGTISSLKTYALVLGERTIRITLAKLLPVEVFNVATTFFAIIYFLP